ncbi:hypothetical protein [Natronorubrum thiooxidans]|uniref:CARDB protein n=1 Tax=Natronorubrum thiooxidans TaxID=308853 RepID=A0A1N7GCM6_9EURY|nr:hypothetical protein [Natronorubrum thiooxidans]SIS10333.1 hypothetical protein SAMN05421752_11153 [Natronorubrum thiooxidans]
MDGTNWSRLGRRPYLFGATLGIGTLVAGRGYGGGDETTTDSAGQETDTPAEQAESKADTTVDQTGGEDETTADTDREEATGDVSLRITATNAPVTGGDILEITAEVENTSETVSRPAIDSLVDGERQSTITTTVAPGETKPLEIGSVRPAPVADTDTVTVRLESETAMAEHTADVLASDEVAAAQTPAREITVRPDTAVLFDLTADALGAYGGRTHWFVDGAYAGHAQGPWHTAYYSHQGAEYWRHTFDTAGTYEVTAAVDGDEGITRAAWTVHVTPTGTAAPTIDGKRPAADSLAAGRNGDLEFELDVTHLDGDLERVVWWLGHVDRLLGVSDVSGAADTAALTLEGGCHGCPIIAWVISTDGTIAEEQVWLLE